MSGPCPVVQVVHDNPEGFVEINESDFNPELHQLYDANKPDQKEQKTSKKADK